MVEPPRKKPKKVELSQRRLVVILEQASLEAAKVGNSFELLASEKHRNFLLKHKKDPASYRPDITHKCLLMLLDSPLNRAGLLQVFVHTTNNILIQINPQLRLPRTYDRFAGLMVQLLHKLSIRAADGREKLMKVVKNPVTSHLPTGCKVLGTSVHVPKLTPLRELPPTEPDTPIALIVGALARGRVAADYAEGEVKLSNFPLSAALTCAKICGAFEDVWAVEEIGPSQGET